MKHLKLILMMVVAANIALVTSCKKDEDDPATPVNENPSISLAGDNGNVAADVTLEPAEAFKITLSAAENPNTKKNLERMVIQTEIAGLKGTLLDSSFSEKTFGPVTINLNAPTIETTQSYTFTVTDKDGKTATTGFVITTVAPVNSTPLGADKTGQFYHIEGSLKGAFDLVNDVEKSASDPDTEKDMKNTDMAGDPFTGSFKTETATRYNKVTESYANILTQEKAEELYNAAVPVTDVASPKSGDTYVVKLRSGDYAVLRIDSVDPADNTCGCTNKGKMSFTYKK